MSDARRSRIAELRHIHDEAEKTVRETAAEILRLAREWEAEHAAEIADATGMRGRERDAFMTGLPSRSKHDTLDAMDATPETHATRISRARITKANRKHPFVAAFVARGETAAAVAKAIGYPRTTMQSWYRSDDSARPIPRAAVDIIQKLYGVPATAWRRITD